MDENVAGVSGLCIRLANWPIASIVFWLRHVLGLPSRAVCSQCLTDFDLVTPARLVHTGRYSYTQCPNPECRRQHRYSRTNVSTHWLKGSIFAVFNRLQVQDVLVCIYCFALALNPTTALRVMGHRRMFNLRHVGRIYQFIRESICLVYQDASDFTGKIGGMHTVSYPWSVAVPFPVPGVPWLLQTTFFYWNPVEIDECWCVCGEGGLLLVRDG
jgi:hypothetical protein